MEPAPSVPSSPADQALPAVLGAPLEAALQDAAAPEFELLPLGAGFYWLRGRRAPHAPAAPETLWRLLERLPERPAVELLAPGLLRVMPSPGAAHQYASLSLWRLLDEREGLRGRRRWWFEWERAVRLGQRLLVPDGCGWRLAPGDRLPPAWTEPNPIERRPDWVVEVLSKSTEAYDRRTKARCYAEAQVPWLWLLDPEARAIEVLRLEAAQPEPCYRRVAQRRWPETRQTSTLPPFEEPIALQELWRPGPAP